MAGMVGNDVFAVRLKGELQAAGVDTTLVREVDSSSGSAMILVLPGGENVIVIAAGANGRVDADPDKLLLRSGITQSGRLRFESVYWKS